MRTSARRRQTAYHDAFKAPMNSAIERPHLHTAPLLSKHWLAIRRFIDWGREFHCNSAKLFPAEGGVDAITWRFITKHEPKPPRREKFSRHTIEISHATFQPRMISVLRKKRRHH